MSRVFAILTQQTVTASGQWVLATRIAGKMPTCRDGRSCCGMRLASAPGKGPGPAAG